MNTESSVPFNWRSPFDLNHPAGGMLSGIVAGLIAGVLTGIAARLVMRVIALTSGASPIFTVQGTLFILRYAAIFGIVLGIIFGFFQPYFSGSVIRKGLKYGSIWSAVTVMMLFANSAESADARSLFILPLFAILPLTYGLLLSWIITRLIPKDQINGNEIAPRAA